jgi:multisubunit Na+/H+ antiporter MnhE subunit
MRSMSASFLDGRGGNNDLDAVVSRDDQSVDVVRITSRIMKSNSECYGNNMNTESNNRNDVNVHERRAVSYLTTANGRDDYDDDYDDDRGLDENRKRGERERRKGKRQQRERQQFMTQRKIDTPLVCFALIAFFLVCIVELKTSPRNIARHVLANAEDFFKYMEKEHVHLQISQWRGWHSLEVGLEIAMALTLGFLNWILFASLFDVAGIIVGLIPAFATVFGILVFRFHARSFLVLLLIPMVVLPAIACAKVLEKRMRLKEERRIRARREHKREQRMKREQQLANGGIIGFGGGIGNNNNNNIGHHNQFVVQQQQLYQHHEDPTQMRGRATKDLTTMRRAMSVGELSPTGTTKVITNSGMNLLSTQKSVGYGLLAARPSSADGNTNTNNTNNTIKGFNALSSNNNNNGSHARHASAPDLGFPSQNHQQQPALPSTNNNNYYFGNGIPDLGGIEHNDAYVPKLQNPKFALNNNGLSKTTRPTNSINLLNAKPSKTAERFNVKAPNLETIHSPLEQRQRQWEDDIEIDERTVDGHSFNSARNTARTLGV